MSAFANGNGSEHGVGVRGGEVLAAAPGGNGDSRAASGPAPATLSPVMTHSRHSYVSRAAVEEAVLLHVAADCRSRGGQIPRDVDFVRKARVYFLDEQNQPVPLSRVHVMWEE